VKTLHFVTSVTTRSEAPPEVVYETVTDLSAHLEWSGERASDDDFKLLELDAPPGNAGVGTAFTSVGANFNGTFRDRSVVTEAAPPNVFVIETDSRLERTRGKPWHVEFRHRYDIKADGTGSLITYTDATRHMNYVPYWLHPLIRPLTRRAIHKADTKQLENLARLAEERWAR
jgi:hypothetical protein